MAEALMPSGESGLMSSALPVTMSLGATGIDDRRRPLPRVERRHQRARRFLEQASTRFPFSGPSLHFGRVGAGERRRARNRACRSRPEVQRHVMDFDAPAPGALGRRRAEHREAIAFRIARHRPVSTTFRIFSSCMICVYVV